MLSQEMFLLFKDHLGKYCVCVFVCLWVHAYFKLHLTQSSVGISGS
jgi:hypothetical protein